MRLGVIGGTGVYHIEGLKNVRTKHVKTLFGDPSDELLFGMLGDVELVFLPRHGRGHRILPMELNYRANIMAMKLQGVDRVISISAVGSLRENLRPCDIILPDQYYDRTKNSKEHTFFGEGMVAHVAFGDPSCPDLRAVIAKSARAVTKREKIKVRVNVGGTYVNMEGPAFSTKAESNLYRKFGFDVIGMTSLAEAKLCREAEICYQAMAMITDYDCWHVSEKAVTMDLITSYLHANSELAKKVLVDTVGRLSETKTCSCGSSLGNALITAENLVPLATKKKLMPILGKYWKKKK